MDSTLSSVLSHAEASFNHGREDDAISLTEPVPAKGPGVGWFRALFMSRAKRKRLSRPSERDFLLAREADNRRDIDAFLAMLPKGPSMNKPLERLEAKRTGGLPLTAMDVLSFKGIIDVYYHENARELAEQGMLLHEDTTLFAMHSMARGLELNTTKERVNALKDFYVAHYAGTMAFDAFRGGKSPKDYEPIPGFSPQTVFRVMYGGSPFGLWMEPGSIVQRRAMEQVFRDLYKKIRPKKQTHGEAEVPPGSLINHGEIEKRFINRIRGALYISPPHDDHTEMAFLSHVDFLVRIKIVPRKFKDEFSQMARRAGIMPGMDQNSLPLILRFYRDVVYPRETGAALRRANLPGKYVKLAVGWLMRSPFWRYAADRTQRYHESIMQTLNRGKLFDRFMQALPVDYLLWLAETDPDPARQLKLMASQSGDAADAQFEEVIRTDKLLRQTAQYEQLGLLPPGERNRFAAFCMREKIPVQDHTRIWAAVALYYAFSAPGVQAARDALRKAGVPEKDLGKAVGDLLQTDDYREAAKRAFGNMPPPLQELDRYMTEMEAARPMAPLIESLPLRMELTDSVDPPTAYPPDPKWAESMAERRKDPLYEDGWTSGQLAFPGELVDIARWTAAIHGNEEILKTIKETSFQAALSYFRVQEELQREFPGANLSPLSGNDTAWDRRPQAPDTSLPNASLDGTAADVLPGSQGKY